MNAVLVEHQEITATHGQVISVLELLATRIQWSTAKPIISDASIHVSRGWAETITTASQNIHGSTLHTTAYQKLSNTAWNHAYFGNKRVSFFDLREQNENYRTKVLSWAQESAMSDLAGILRERPFNILEAPTKKQALDLYKTSPPQLIEAKFFGNRLHLQFFSTRSYTFREPIDISLMTATQQKSFIEYEKLIGVRTKCIPCFDTVAIDPTNELIEIRLDFQPGIIEDRDHSPLSRVIDALNRIGRKYIQQDICSTGLINLHPTINPMYLDESCGRVTTLGFVATGRDSSSNNQGQLHRSKTKDLRKDEFHLGGRLHVEKIDPYAIGITWSQQDPKSDLNLEISGSARALYNRTYGQVSEAEIVGCMNVQDYEFVRNQILSRLKRTKK